MRCVEMERCKVREVWFSAMMRNKFFRRRNDGQGDPNDSLHSKEERK